MIWDIAAVIGFLFLLIFAFIGVVFTARAWVFAGTLAIEEYKQNKLSKTNPDVALNLILTQQEKEALKASKKNEKGN